MCEEEEQGEGVEGQGVVNILTDFFVVFFKSLGNGSVAGNWEKGTKIACTVVQVTVQWNEVCNRLLSACR